MMPYLSLQDRAQRDPHYAHLAKADYALLAQAGFTDDGLDKPVMSTPISDPSWLTTPWGKIRRNLDADLHSSRPPAVLLTTGGFAPVHNGHIAMMEAAKIACEAKGYRVVGGYLSPSHDAYVSKKHGGDITLSAPFRTGLIESAVHGSDWLDVDPWEARYVPTDINFTDVLRRLDRYLHWHLSPERSLTMFYVFGGDNAGFVRAFDIIGHAICVERPGQEATVAPMRDHAGRNKRVIFAKSTLTEDIASRALRPSGAHRPSLMANRASAMKAAVTGSTGTYLIRDDLRDSTSEWSSWKWDGYKEACKTFRDDVVAAIECAFLQANPKPTQGRVPVQIIDLAYQRTMASYTLQDKQSISFDVHISGYGPNCHQIGMTRSFDLANGQIQTDRFVARPGQPDLETQFSVIPPGHYVLVEDDIGSGRTLQEIESRLPKGVILDDLILLNTYRRNADSGVFDIVDLRDFMLGASHGGLTVELADGTTARAPYLLPFVSLRSRAKIPASTEWRTSLDLWRANLKFFRSSHLTIADAHPATQTLLKSAGHIPQTMLLADVCQAEIARILTANPDTSVR